MKSLKKLFLVQGLVLGASVVSHAAVSDSLTVTIRPNAFYAVDIDTTNVVLDLGTVDLGLSTQTVSPSTVTIQSTYATTDLRLQGAIGSAGTPWTFDADTSDQDDNQLAAWATFTDVSVTAAPTQGGGYFAGTTPNVSNSGVISATSRRVGDDGAVLNLFEATGEAGVKSMNNLAVNDESHLWLNFRMPSASDTNDPQNVTITLTAVAPN